jgi:hydroxylysine kinase
MSASVIDGAGLASSHVRLPPAEAVALAAERFGIVGSAVRFETEKDDTFKISTERGDAVILKVGNPGEDAAEIDLQIALLDHLKSRDCGAAIPGVVTDLDGRKVFTYVDKAGQSRLVRMLTFVRGLPLSDTTSSAVGRQHVGRVLAQLRLAMQDFSHQHDSRKLAWDVTHLDELEPLLAYIPDREHRDQLERGLDRFRRVSHSLATVRKQVLHNDFSRSNIVVDHNAPGFVTGIIDFGDTVRTAIAVDVSTALLNQLPSAPREDLLLEGRDVLRGYLGVADLMPAELELVPHLVMGRIIARALITHWRSALFPENAPYIIRNTAQGWGQLDWFLRRSPEAVSSELRDLSLETH